MLNIADFGGFSGIAKLIQQVKDTGKKLDILAESTGVTQITDLRVKYIDTLDQFRPGNTSGVESVADDFSADVEKVLAVLKSNISDPKELEIAEQAFTESTDTITDLLGIVMNALKKAS